VKLETLLAIERNAGRIREILGVLVKYGLADWLKGIHYEWLQSRLVSYDGQHIHELPTEVRMRLALTELGTTFIKLGQMLSTRADLVGTEMARELSRLQASTPADPPESIRHLFEKELARKPEEAFAEFNDQAFASASVAQVHHALLRSGERVVVKIQHADIEERVRRDLEILLGLAELAEKHAPALHAYQPVATARQFRSTTLRELDFLHERRHLEQFARNFEHDDTVRFPAVIDGLCSKRVLTMEYLDGISGADEAGIKQVGGDLDEFARRGAMMYLNMIFRDGFYHADPHPANMMLLPEGVVGVIDCGMVGRLDETFREDVEELLLAAASRDAVQLTNTVLRIATVPADCARDELRAEIGEFLANFVGTPLKEFDLSEALNGIVDIIRRHRLVLPPGLSLLIKVLVMLDGTSRRLDPHFSMAELIAPFYVQSVRRRLSPQRFIRRLQRAYHDWDRLVDALPRDLRDILTRMRSGSFNVRLEHRRIETAVNRLVLGILTAALFLGSSQMWSQKAPPLVGGVSFFGIIGYVLSFYLGYRLLGAIRRSGDIWRKDDE
jgi:ubiquinone biosynthesis protein